MTLPLTTQSLQSYVLSANGPDSGVEWVGDVENARSVVEEQANGVVEHHFCRRPLLAVETRLACTGDGGYRAGRIDLSDHAVVVVGEEHVSFSIDGDAPRVFQSSLGGRPSVPRVALFARAREGGDDAVFVDHPDPLVLRVGDVDVSLAIERNVVGAQLRLGSRATVTREASPPGAGDGRDRAGRIDLSHAGVVGQVEVPSIVEGDAARIGEFCGGGRASVPGMPLLARAGEGGDDSVLVDLANPIVVLV